MPRVKRASAMVRIRRVLCPVDFSNVSDLALRHAASLAAWYDARLTILFVRMGERVTSAEGDLAAFVDSAVGADAGSGRADLRVVDGDVASEIVGLAAALPSDVVVMGTHGISGFKQLLLGSVTERVLREAPCPVLTVPAHLRGLSPAAKSFATIVCAVDFSPSSARALDYAVSIAGKAGGRLVVFHALEWANEDAEQTAADGKGTGLPTAEEDARHDLDALLTAGARTCKPELLVGRGAPHAEVLRIANEYQAGLIVLGVHRRNVVDRTLFGSTTQRITRDARCLVLTVRT